MKLLSISDPVSPETTNVIFEDIYAHIATLSNSFRGLSIPHTSSVRYISEEHDLCVLRNSSNPIPLFQNQLNEDILITKAIFSAGTATTTVSEDDVGFTPVEAETALVELNDGTNTILAEQRVGITYSNTYKVINIALAHKLSPSETLYWQINEASSNFFIAQPVKLIVEGIRV